MGDMKLSTISELLEASHHTYGQDLWVVIDSSGWHSATPYGPFPTVEHAMKFAKKYAKMHMNKHDYGKKQARKMQEKHLHVERIRAAE